MRGRLRFAFLILSGAVFSSCIGASGKSKSEDTVPPLPQSSCPEITELPSSAGPGGEGSVFQIDPATDSGDLNLSPGSSSVGNAAARVTLERLSGQGLLEGTYATVVSGLCGKKPGAFEPEQRFVYPHGDGRFAEVMNYFHADRFRSRLDSAGALLPSRPVRMIANCSVKDNAYYTLERDASGDLVDTVCMGTSKRFAKGNFSDDSQVIIHELQHAMTGHAYSPHDDFNRLRYDDAGSINEGISDFVALLLSDDSGSRAPDPKLFSLWALGSLLTNQARGAHLCPTYDPTYPDCGGARGFPQGFSADANRLSFVYPDGIGWPFPASRSGPGFLRNHFLANLSAEEIHQNGIIAAGVLWDAYENLKRIVSIEEARNKMLKLIAESVAALPKPNGSQDVSPVTYPVLGKKLVETAALMGWSSAERGAVQAATDARGLTSSPQLPSGWAEIGPGKSITPGLHVIDSSSTGGQPNNKLNRGDFAAVFFDIRNLAERTAGSLLLDVSVTTSSIEFLDGNDNYGYVNPSRAMIRYAKVNGTGIVNALASTNASYHVPIGNTYFTTNPQYGNRATMTTELYVYIPESAPTGVFSFRVRVQPSNGPEAILKFPVEIFP